MVSIIEACLMVHLPSYIFHLPSHFFHLRHRHPCRLLLQCRLRLDLLDHQLLCRYPSTAWRRTTPQAYPFGDVPCLRLLYIIVPHRQLHLLDWCHLYSGFLHLRSLVRPLRLRSVHQVTAQWPSHPLYLHRLPIALLCPRHPLPTSVGIPFRLWVIDAQRSPHLFRTMGRGKKQRPRSHCVVPD